MNEPDVGVIIINEPLELIPEGTQFPTNFEIYRVNDPHDLMAPEQSHDIEIVIFDREHPNIEVEAFLERIGSLRYQYQLALITHGTSRFRFVQAGVDAFISKPPTAGEIRETVTDLVDREIYARRRREFSSLLSARKSLEQELSASDLLAKDEYLDICDRIKVLSEQLGKSNDRLKSKTEFVSHLRDIENRTSTPV